MRTWRTIDRRTLLRAGAVGMGAPLALPACARGVSEEGAELAQPEMDVPQKYRGRDQNLVLWSPFGDVNGRVLNELMSEFNDSQDDIYVDVQFQGNYNEQATKLAAALQGNSAPDLIILNQVYAGKYVLQGVMEPLDDYLDDSFLQTYLPQFSEEWIIGDQLYQLPFARSTPILYYNREVFEKAGLPMRGPETWSELKSWGEDIAKVDDPAGGSMRSHVLTPDNQDWPFQAEVWQFGGSLSNGLDVTADEGGAVECAEWFQETIEEDQTAFVDDLEAFTGGFAAAAVASTAGLRSITDASDFEVGAAFMPEEQEAAVPTGGSGWMMFSGVPDERKAAAAEVVKFFGTGEIAARWTVGTGYLPVVDGVMETSDYQQQVQEDPNFNVARDQLEVARQTDHIRIFISSSTSILVETLANIYQRGQDVQRAMTNGADKLREEADKVRESYDEYFG